jgi:tetratricopeptide (TPR) repeat protein
MPVVQQSPSSLLALAGIVTALEKYEEAGQLYQDGLVLADELGDPGMKATCYEGQATIAAALGNHAEAEQLFERCLALATEAGVQWRSLLALIGLGHAALALGNAQRSRKCFRDALGGAMDAGYVPLGLNALVGLAHLLSTEKQPQRAVEFLTLSLRHPTTWQRTKDAAQSLLSELKSRLSPEAFAAATAQGQARELEELAAEVLKRNATAH